MKKYLLLVLCITLHATDHPEDLLDHIYQLQEQEQFDEGIEVAQQYLAHNGSKKIQAYFALGCMALKVGQFDLALQSFDAILARYPDTVPVLYNKAYTLKTAGYIDEALAIYQQLIDKDPNYEPARLGLSFGLISKGDFVRGWPAHEWHLKQAGKYAPQLRNLLQTGTIAGKTILLTPEGGLGDTLHFVRYAERLKDMGATVFVSAQPALLPLLNNCPYIDQLFATKEHTPPFDAYATLMSLPATFYDTATTFPKKFPYLFADPERSAYWHAQLAHDTNFKIGICWQTSVHNDISRMPIARRGIPLEQFFKLHDIPGISWYSLQQVEGLEQLTCVPSTFNLYTFGDDFDKTHGSFMDTAAVMQELDLIISVDTAVAHLAGGLGKPVWLLLPFATDWRWIHNRTDSPWYPLMRIFKQPYPFDWDSVMHNIHEQLNLLLAY